MYICVYMLDHVVLRARSLPRLEAFYSGMARYDKDIEVMI